MYIKFWLKDLSKTYAWTGPFSIGIDVQPS